MSTKPVQVQSCLYYENLFFQPTAIVATHKDIMLEFFAASHPPTAKEGTLLAKNQHRILLPSHSPTGEVRATTTRDIGLYAEDFAPAADDHPMFLDMGKATQDVQDRMYNLWSELEELAAKSIRLLRWRFGANLAKADAIAKHRFVIPRTGEVWAVPEGLRLTTRLSTIIPNNFSDDLDRMLAANIDEPVAQDLLHEAQGHLDANNPRAAHVLAVAAAEVAIKSYISLRVPNADWLIMNLPSPPLTDICRKYLPEVKNFRGEESAIPKQLISKLEQAVKTRNQLIHKGVAISQRDAEDAHSTCYMLTSTLDYHSGCEWLKPIAPLSGPAPKPKSA